MWEFIVLGEVPGTSLQVSFETWLIAMAALSIVVYLIRHARLQRITLLFTIAAYLYSWRLIHWLVTLRRASQPVLPLATSK